MNGTGGGGGRPIEVGRLIDEAPLGALHLRVFLLCIAVGVLDGIDTQSIGVAASAMAAELAIPTARFGPIFSAMLLGAALGAICFGSLADRIGRKRLLIAATVIFALATLLTAHAHSFAQLLALRFVAGLGLGGATPCFLALGTEYAPLRWRRGITAALWAGFPLGATLGGFLNAYLLAHFDWRALFYVGGTAPLVLALLLAALMPESLKYLVRRGAAPGRIARIARALDPRIAADARLVDGARAAGPGQGVAAAIPVAATAQLWTGFFLIFGILAVLVLWTPLLLHAEGMDPARAAGLIGLNGLGALLGTAGAAPLIARFGIRVLTPALALAALGIGAIAAAGIDFAVVGGLIVLAGFGLGVGSGSVLTLAAQLYPDARRSAGIGWAMGVGRIGQFCGPLLVSLLLLAQLPPKAIFASLALAPLIGAVVLLPLQRRMRAAA